MSDHRPIRDTLGRDFLASIVVFLVALPLCMGIAIASGAPPAKGLLTGIVGGIVVGALAGSPLQVSGPAAGLAVLVFEVVQHYGLGLLGPLLLAAGLIQLVAGLCRLGGWFRAISPAVIYGMLAGIGLLIVGAQFHVMLDGQPRPSGIENFSAAVPAVLDGLVKSGDSIPAAALGVLTIATVAAWDKLRPRSLRLVPGALLGVVLATLAAALLGLPVKLVDVPADLWLAVDLPGWDEFARLADPSLLATAFALAVIASAETLLSAAAVDRMHNGPRTRYDRELAAQGVGNMLCGVLGALPMTGVIVRSSANVQAGAVTRLSAVLHGIWILGFVLVLPSVLRLVPTASLAGVLVYTGFKLVNPGHIRLLMRYGRVPVLVYAATLVTIVTTDLLTGVFVGMGLSLVRLLWNLSRLEIRLDHDPAARQATLRLSGTASFLGAPRLARMLDQLPPGTRLQVEVDGLSYVDHACMELLANWVRQNEGKGAASAVPWDALHSRHPARGAMVPTAS